MLPDQFPSGSLWDLAFSLSIYSLIFLAALLVVWGASKFGSIIPASETMRRYAHREAAEFSKDIFASVERNAEKLNSKLDSLVLRVKECDRKSASFSSKIESLQSAFNEQNRRLSALEEISLSKPVGGSPVLSASIAQPDTGYTSEELRLLKEAEVGLSKAFVFDATLIPDQVFLSISPREEAFMRMILDNEINFPFDLARRTAGGLTGRFSGEDVRVMAQALENRGLITSRQAHLEPGRGGRMATVYSTSARGRDLFALNWKFPMDGGEEAEVIFRSGRKKAWEIGHRVIPLHVTPLRENQPDALKVAPDTQLQWKWSEVAAIEVLSSRKIRNEPRGVFVDAVKNFQYSFRVVALWFPAELTQNVEKQWSRLPPWLQQRVILVPLEITVPNDDEDENEFEDAYLNDQGFPDWYRPQQFPV
jgi:hypothetical protein